jgi:acetoin utilization protein AcuB
MMNRCPECGTTLPRGVPAWTRQLTVADAMTKDPATLGPEDSLMKAVEMMRKRGIRRLPVVVGDMIVGLLAEGDLKRAQPSALSDSEAEFIQVMDETPISRIMIQNPITTTEGASLLEAAQTLHTTKYGALPVLRDGKLIGIITDSDLVQSLVHLLSHGG